MSDLSKSSYQYKREFYNWLFSIINKVYEQYGRGIMKKYLTAPSLRNEWLGWPRSYRKNGFSEHLELMQGRGLCDIAQEFIPEITSTVVGRSVIQGVITLAKKNHDVPLECACEEARYRRSLFAYGAGKQSVSVRRGLFSLDDKAREDLNHKLGENAREKGLGLFSLSTSQRQAASIKSVLIRGYTAYSTQELNRLLVLTKDPQYVRNKMGKYVICWKKIAQVLHKETALYRSPGAIKNVYERRIVR